MPSTLKHKILTGFNYSDGRQSALDRGCKWSRIGEMIKSILRPDPISIHFDRHVFFEVAPKDSHRKNFYRQRVEAVNGGVR